MLCGSGRLFLVSGLGSGFLVTGLHSSSLRLFLFFPCSTWYKCAELVSWSFGHFYPELYDSSLAWTPCLCFFSFVRWFSPLNLWLCFWCIKNVSSGFVVTLAFRLLFFLWSAFLVLRVGAWSHFLCVRWIVLSQILSLYIFLTFVCFSQDTLR